jgi:hypothetical protein
MGVWMGHYIKEVYEGKRNNLKDLVGEKVKIVAPLPHRLDKGIIFVCESGKRIFHRTGDSPDFPRDWMIESEVFSDEEILFYDEAVRKKEKERKEQACRRDKKEYERLKERLGEC